MILYTGLFCIFLLSGSILDNCAAQQMAAGCHCFKDRSYDPARKFAADDYMLAKSFNSMLASYFNISKRQIIMMRMQGGVDGQDLTMSLYLGKITGTDFKDILSLRSNGQSWKQIVADHKARIQSDNPVAIVTEPKDDEQEIVNTVVTMLVTDYFAIPPESIDKYRSNGLSDKEVVLCLGLSAQSGKSIDELLSRYKEEGQSWGEIANSLGIAAADIGTIITNVRMKE
jgi:hypothetical protein